MLGLNILASKIQVHIINKQFKAREKNFHSFPSFSMTKTRDLKSKWETSWCIT